jgi:hypothetical protein
MAATYVNVTQSDVEEFLGPQGFEQIFLPGVRELVYAARRDEDGQQLSLRVYTGIEPDGLSRAAGADAMRAVLFFRDATGHVAKLATSKRVHRVAGWRVNLQDRLDGLRPGPRCSDCGSPMVRRKGKKGEFYGCSSYPRCTHTREV